MQRELQAKGPKVKTCPVLFKEQHTYQNGPSRMSKGERSGTWGWGGRRQPEHGSLWATAMTYIYLGWHVSPRHRFWAEKWLGLTCFHGISLAVGLIKKKKKTDCQNSSREAYSRNHYGCTDRRNWWLDQDVIKMRSDHIIRIFWRRNQ